ncbi:helix-turn-helix transcriptional regulator [Hydrogenophaga sp.]|uniref:response regulator transcription factor n=1 Tax=Hydrogenophaga sp. TaxID=1904254 RepID=UPI00345AECE2
MQLSDRERESLLAAADGLTAKEAGERMGCTERTVTHHWTRAMEKLQAKNKVQAVQNATILGLL